MPGAEAILQTKITRSNEALDAWVREVIQWHFDPATGCPFWLDYSKALSWDPRDEVQTYDDLSRFGFFQDEWLRGGPVRAIAGTAADAGTCLPPLQGNSRDGSASVTPAMPHGRLRYDIDPRFGARRRASARVGSPWPGGGYRVDSRPRRDGRRGARICPGISPAA